MIFRFNSFLLVSLFILFSLQLKASAEDSKDSGKKGLFLIQFSWDNASFTEDYRIKINYRKISKLPFPAPSIQTTPYGNKNVTTTLELPEGAYEIYSVDFISNELARMNQKFTVHLGQPFVVKPGEVTNGGITWIVKDPETKRVILFYLDNEQDARWHINQYEKKYVSRVVNPAWKFTEEERISNLKKEYGKFLVADEKTITGSDVKYVYGMLGILLKLEKDPKGNITGYQSIQANTYREILQVATAKGKLLCNLGEGQYLYGTDANVSVLTLPDDMESKPHVFMIDADKLLAFDENINIYSTNDESLAWKKQSDCRVETAPMNQHFNIPKLTWGPDKIYLYTTGPSKFRRLWSSGYDSIYFKKVDLPEEINRIPNLIATRSKLIIGPIPSSLTKNQASIFVKETGSDTWQLVTTPRGNCNTLTVDSNDNNKFTISCGTSKTRIYTSADAGKTWEQIE